MAVESLSSSDLNTDIYLCVGFGLAFAGLVFKEIWWIFGGTLIFVSPFIGRVLDDHAVKSKGVKTNATQEMQNSSRLPGWKIPRCEEERRRDQEAILLGRN
jgi:hypothetical protein